MVIKNVYERNIIWILTECKIPLTTKQIATKLDIHWSTTIKHLSELYRRKMVYRTKIGKKAYWSTSRNKLKSFLE